MWLYQSQPSGLGPERVVFSTEEGMRLEQRERERRARDGGPLLEDQANDVTVVDRVTDAHSNPCTVCNHVYNKVTAVGLFWIQTEARVLLPSCCPTLLSC